MCSLFVLAEVRARGPANAAAPLAGRVPLDSVPELLCGLGCYPAQQDISDMVSGLGHAAARRGEQPPADVTFEELLALLHTWRNAGEVRLPC